jgi:hypothetical protein
VWSGADIPQLFLGAFVLVPVADTYLLIENGFCSQNIPCRILTDA